MSGSFTGTWSLRYYDPFTAGAMDNYLQLSANYDSNEHFGNAYLNSLIFRYATETELCIAGLYFKDGEGWSHYLRGEAEPNF